MNRFYIIISFFNEFFYLCRTTGRTLIYLLFFEAYSARPFLHCKSVFHQFRAGLCVGFIAFFHDAIFTVRNRAKWSARLSFRFERSPRAVWNSQPHLVSKRLLVCNYRFYSGKTFFWCGKAPHSSYTVYCLGNSVKPLSQKTCWFAWVNQHRWDRNFNGLVH